MQGEAIEVKYWEALKAIDDGFTVRSQTGLEMRASTLISGTYDTKSKRWNRFKSYYKALRKPGKQDIEGEWEIVK